MVLFHLTLPCAPLVPHQTYLVHAKLQAREGALGLACGLGELEATGRATGRAGGLRALGGLNVLGLSWTRTCRSPEPPAGLRTLRPPAGWRWVVAGVNRQRGSGACGEAR